MLQISTQPIDSKQSPSFIPRRLLTLLFSTQPSFEMEDNTITRNGITIWAENSSGRRYKILGFEDTCSTRAVVRIGVPYPVTNMARGRNTVSPQCLRMC